MKGCLEYACETGFTITKKSPKPHLVRKPLNRDFIVIQQPELTTYLDCLFYFLRTIIYTPNNSEWTKIQETKEDTHLFYHSDHNF